MTGKINLNIHPDSSTNYLKKKSVLIRIILCPIYTRSKPSNLVKEIPPITGYSPLYHQFSFSPNHSHQHINMLQFLPPNSSFPLHMPPGGLVTVVDLFSLYKTPQKSCSYTWFLVSSPLFFFETSHFSFHSHHSTIILHVKVTKNSTMPKSILSSHFPWLFNILILLFIPSPYIFYSLAS